MDELGVQNRVMGVEKEEVPRGVAAKWDAQHVGPQKIEDWVRDEQGSRARIASWDKCDMVTCGFPCQDLASARSGGVGLQLAGEKSGLVYDCATVVRWIQEAWPKVRFMFECAIDEDEWGDTALPELDACRVGCMATHGSKARAGDFSG